MSDAKALEPALGTYDKWVLTAIPACGERESGRPNGPRARRETDETATLWQIAETLDTVDLLGPAGLIAEIAGLERLGYVDQALSVSKKRTVYWRTPKGDEALTA